MTILNFSIDFTEAQLTGIAQARTAYNAISESQLTDSEYLEYVLLGAANSYAAQYSGSAPVPPSPVAPVADWDGLLNRLLAGDLHPLFQAITLAAFSNPLVLIARNDIYGAISNLKISDRISALRSGLDMLLQSGYQISDSDCIIWNTAMAELNFPDEIKL